MTMLNNEDILKIAKWRTEMRENRMHGITISWQTDNQVVDDITGEPIESEVTEHTVYTEGVVTGVSGFASYPKRLLRGMEVTKDDLRVSVNLADTEDIPFKHQTIYLSIDYLEDRKFLVISCYKKGIGDLTRYEMTVQEVI